MYLTQFEQALQDEDKSAKTISGYLTSIIAFGRWFDETNGQRPEPKYITSIDLRLWKQYLLNIKGYKPGAINFKLANAKISRLGK